MGPGAARVSVVSEPAGATVTIRPFGSAGEAIPLGPPRFAGQDPARRLSLARRAARLPACRLDHRNTGGSLRFDLRADSPPDHDMVRIPAGEMRLWVLRGRVSRAGVSLGAFLVDRREVTNRAFATFVAAGGYTREEFWKHQFRDGTQPLAVSRGDGSIQGRDRAAGPAAWKLGTYPDGEEELPVSGVSWSEAAAYAAFAGKELPTIFHWSLADKAGDIQLLPGLVLSGANRERWGPPGRTPPIGGRVRRDRHGGQRQ